MALWNHFDWLHRIAELPWKPVGDCKPKGAKGIVIAGGNQSVPPDPEILIMLDQEAVAKQYIDEERSAALDFARFAWMSCLRERHVQRSVLTKLGTHFLWGICTRGKNKPGFAWGAPRFTPTGDDLGGKVWAAWKDASVAAGQARRYAMVGNSGEMVKSGEAAAVVRFLLDKNNVGNPEIFTLRGMRRVQPTMLGQRMAPEQERIAVGDWQGCTRRDGGPQIAPMPVLYDADKVRTAAFTKLVQVLCLQEIARESQRRLDWATYGVELNALNIDEIYKEAEQALLCDDIVDEPPPDSLPDFIQPAKQFFFARDQVAAAKSEMQWQASASPDYGLQDVQLEETKEEDEFEETDETITGVKEEAAEKKEESAPASSGWQQDEALLEQRLAGLPRDVKWEATKSKAHFIIEEGKPPWCAQRQGQRAKRLVRLVAKGESVRTLLCMMDAVKFRICEDCLQLAGI